jgi:RNA recognition motif-containing protein
LLLGKETVWSLLCIRVNKKQRFGSQSILIYFFISYTMKLFIGNLSWKMRDADLRAAFEPFGEVTDAVIIMERDNPGRSRGFGFVTFANEEDGRAAIDQMHEQELEGRNIIVNEAQPRD